MLSTFAEFVPILSPTISIFTINMAHQSPDYERLFLERQRALDEAERGKEGEKRTREEAERGRKKKNAPAKKLKRKPSRQPYLNSLTPAISIST
jgi:hypothetical protein